MPDTNNNIQTFVFDTDYALLATDYHSIQQPSGFTSAHLQVVKLAWGDQSNSFRVSDQFPMPVSIRGVTNSPLVGITGTVRGTGPFAVINQPNTFIVVGGPAGAAPSGYAPVQITGAVQGITNGVLVGITGTVRLNTSYNLNVQGVTNGILVGVTGGRYLNSTTDSVTVVGNFGVSGPLGITYGTNSVAVWGSDLGNKVLTRLYGSGGETVGVSGGALNVNIVGSGVAASVTVSTVVGVTNPNGAALKICGSTFTSDAPVTIQGKLAGGVVEVGAITPIPVSITGPVDIDDASLISSLESPTKPLISNLITIKNNTAVISTINDKLTNGVVQSKITEIIKPTKLTNGSMEVSSTAAAISPVSPIKTGVHVKAPLSNTDTVYIGSSNLTTAPSSGFPLEPGESIFIEIDNVNKVYARSNTLKQKITYLAT